MTSYLDPWLYPQTNLYWLDLELLVLYNPIFGDNRIWAVNQLFDYYQRILYRIHQYEYRNRKKWLLEENQTRKTTILKILQDIWRTMDISTIEAFCIRGIWSVFIIILQDLYRDPNKVIISPTWRTCESEKSYSTYPKIERGDLSILHLFRLVEIVIHPDTIPKVDMASFWEFVDKIYDICDTSMEAFSMVPKENRQEYFSRMKQSITTFLI